VLLPAVLLALAAIVAVALRQRWTWIAPVTTRVRRADPYVRAYIRSSPATFVYLFVLLITTWVLRTSTVTLGKQLLWLHSTNLTHLRDDPLSVLVTSAFWLTGFEIVAWLVLFPLVLAPAEKWLGTVRAIVAFTVGHVGATLLTAGGIAFMVRHGLAPRRLRDVIDVGSSYGFFAVAAVFSYRFRGRWGLLWAGALLLGTGSMIVVQTEFADYGHLVAVLIGLLLYPLTRAEGVRTRSRWPIWRPPSLLVDAERDRLVAARRLHRHPEAGADPE
jgi:hypothetical protein